MVRSEVVVVVLLLRLAHMMCIIVCVCPFSIVFRYICWNTCHWWTLVIILRPPAGTLLIQFIFLRIKALWFHSAHHEPPGGNRLLHHLSKFGCSMPSPDDAHFTCGCPFHVWVFVHELLIQTRKNY